MPFTHVLATKLGAKLTEVRKNKTCPWLRPDGKTQVAVEYNNDGGAMVPIRVHIVLTSTQHDETVNNDQIAKDLKEHVIKPVISLQYLDDRTIFHLNPSGRLVIGGPHGDAGLTGRKIIIDTYGGWVLMVEVLSRARILRRWTGVVRTYAIGVVEPFSVFVATYKTREDSGQGYICPY